MTESDPSNLKRIIDQAIGMFDLDLSGLTILTEAANGNYYVTPLIAALAGAKVYAFAKNSPYGNRDEVVEYFTRQIDRFSIGSSINIINEISDQVLEDCKIITNLGMLRPLDKDFVRRLNDKTVITSMCEAWEVRDKDIDLNECYKQGILVGAVNESSPFRDIFRYVGYLAMKMIMIADLEVLYNRFLIIGSDRFAEVICDVLRLNCAEIQVIEPQQFYSDLLVKNNLQALVIADYSYAEPIVANNGIITPEFLRDQCPGMKVIHLAGIVDHLALKENGIYCFPEKQGYSRRMSHTLDYLGITPLIELHAAGLKVGEILYRERAKGTSIEEIKESLTNNPLCQVIS